MPTFQKVQNVFQEENQIFSEIDSAAAQKIQPELISGENIYWAGRPNPRIIFHADDWMLIPFSLFWAGFVVSWEGEVFHLWKPNSAAPVSLFMALWGIPFLIAGNYLVWGRFFIDGWLKRHTYYAITNRRVFLLQESWTRKTSSLFLGEIPNIERENNKAGVGTLWLGPQYPVLGSKRSKKRNMSRFSLGDTPVFADIENVDAVHRLLIELRDQRAPNSSKVLTY